MHIATKDYTMTLEVQEQAILASLDNDKAEQVSVIDLRGKTSFADKMIIADGRSSRHISSMADKLSTSLKDMGVPILGVEGTENCDWVLIDTGDIVVHLFKPGLREVYNLEKMWAVPIPDAEVVTV